MTCFHPLDAWKSRDLNSKQMVFCASKGFPGTHTLLPCGQCSGCRLARSRAWAVRIMHETKLFKKSCFVTLTYSDENLPLTEQGLPTLDKTHFTLFMKRLRKRFGSGIRYFQCGEYGEQLARPHHHAILFGIEFDDITLYSRNMGVSIYHSMVLESLWNKGFVTVGSVTFDSAAYVARYIMKKQTGSDADAHYQGREPEYITMSRRPGIGRLFYDKYKDDLYNYDKCVVLNNFVLKPPKYYDSLYDLENPERLKRLKQQRKESATNLCPHTDRERLDTLEKHQHLVMNRYVRDYKKID